MNQIDEKFKCKLCEFELGSEKYLYEYLRTIHGKNAMPV